MLSIQLGEMKPMIMTEMVTSIQIKVIRKREINKLSCIHVSLLPLCTLCSLFPTMLTFPVCPVLTSVTVVSSYPLDGQFITELTGHTSYVNSIAFSPDGKTIATCSDDKTGRLYSTGTQLHITLASMSFWSYCNITSSRSPPSDTRPWYDIMTCFSCNRGLPRHINILLMS